MKNLNLLDKKNKDHFSIIRNGSNPKVFNSKLYSKWDGKSAFKFVTHHWSGHWMKGFDVYKKIDNLISSQKWKNKIQFTYIGNKPSNLTFKNIKYIKPLDGQKLSKELSLHHGYLTASINEPGGNHQNEGALCGLPLLYRNSGCLPEYCKGFGECFDFGNIEEKIYKFLYKYNFYEKKMSKYPYTDTLTNKKYSKLFNSLINSRDKIVNDRSLFKSFIKLCLNYFI